MKILQSLVFLSRVQTPIWMSVTYISSLSLDTRKKIIGALESVIPSQEFILCPRFFNFYLGAETFKFKVF